MIRDFFFGKKTFQKLGGSVHSLPEKVEPHLFVFGAFQQ